MVEHSWAILSLALLLLASTRLLLQSDWQKRIHRIEEIMRDKLSIAKNWKSVDDVRILGA